MQALEERRVEALEAVRRARAEAVASRRPLVRKGAVKNAEVKLFNPRFEEDFVAGKNYDPDRRGPRHITLLARSCLMILTSVFPCSSLATAFSLRLLGDTSHLSLAARQRQTATPAM